MSKMGMEFDRKLDEAKYDLYYALKALRGLMNDDTKFRMQIKDFGSEFEADSIFRKCDKALDKVEK